MLNLEHSKKEAKLIRRRFNDFRPLDYRRHGIANRARDFVGIDKPNAYTLCGPAIARVNHIFEKYGIIYAPEINFYTYTKDMLPRVKELGLEDRVIPMLGDFGVNARNVPREHIIHMVNFDICDTLKERQLVCLVTAIANLPLGDKLWVSMTLSRRDTMNYNEPGQKAFRLWMHNHGWSNPLGERYTEEYGNTKSGTSLMVLVSIPFVRKSLVKYLSI